MDKKNEKPKNIININVNGESLREKVVVKKRKTKKIFKKGFEEIKVNQFEGEKNKEENIDKPIKRKTTNKIVFNRIEPEDNLLLKKKSIILKNRKKLGKEKKILIMKFMRWVIYSFITIFVLGIIFLVYLYNIVPYKLENYFHAQSTIIYDREGNELYSIHGEENRTWVTLSEIPEALIKSTLAIEDDDFYNHFGIDIGATTKAVIHEFTGLGSKRGGSTITQQLAKNLFFTTERSYMRKLKDMISAIKMERNYSKDKILESYLNTIPYGSNAYGAMSAAKLYFNKELKDLTLAESVVLASLPNAPSLYSPYGQRKYSYLKVSLDSLKSREIKGEEDLKEKEFVRGLIGKLNSISDTEQIYIRGRVDLVLRRMHELGYITEEQKNQAWQESQNLEFNRFRENIKFPHFVIHIKKILEEQYGKELLEQGGLKVITTIDPVLQNAAEDIVKEIGEINEKKYGVKNASLVSLDTESGHVLAMVGSRDYFDLDNDGNVNVALNYRLPGSSFKPFAYLSAFLEGYAPATVVYDLETQFDNNYRPKNYDGTFSGPVTLRKALGHSLNIPAVKAGFLGGIDNLISIVRRMGVDLPQDDSWYGLSLSLGAGEVRLIDMVSAYSVFARNGIRKEPVYILKIVDSNGNIILDNTDIFEGEEVINPQAAYLITDVLSDPGARGPGWNQYLQIDNQVIASKTGTSNKKVNNTTVPSDAWTIGYTPYIVTGVWAGNNDGSPLNFNAAGLTVAGPIYHQFMEFAHKDRENKDFTKPEGMKWVRVSSISGKRPSEYTPADKIQNEIFADFNLPSEIDDSYKKVEIDAVTGLLASDECPKDAREMKTFVNYHSVRPDIEAWETPVREWVKKNFEDLGEAPTEYCTIKEGDPRLSKPKIFISSPSNGGLVGAPGVGIWVEISSENDIKSVEYYFDGEYVGASNSYPYKGTISLDYPEGSVHTIQAKVIDEYYNTDTDTVEVEIGVDNTPPEISIVYPEDGDKIYAGSSVTVRVDTRDDMGDVDYVVYSIGDKTLAKKLKYPFDFIFSIPKDNGVYDLKAEAYDKSGNKSYSEISFKVIDKKNTSDFSIDILSPSNGKTFSRDEWIPIKIFVDLEYTEQLKRVDLLVDGEIFEQIHEFNETGLFEISINRLKLGDHILQLKSFDDDNHVKYSKKVELSIE